MASTMSIHAPFPVLLLFPATAGVSVSRRRTKCGGIQQREVRLNTIADKCFPKRDAFQTACYCQICLSCHEESEELSKETRRKSEIQQTIGVQMAISLLKFYKREISPFLPRSCRYVPTCSEYSVEAYKRYGLFKGTILTAWRLCRCNPLGGSGFDPPRWFNESKPPSY